MNEEGNPDELYFIVRNHEEQYSIWRADKPVPAGWQTVESPASKDACLKRIGELWTDMRPASLRHSMESGVAGGSSTNDQRDVLLHH